MLIASRAVQGVGCGGILSLSEIIIGDLGASLPASLSLHARPD